MDPAPQPPIGPAAGPTGVPTVRSSGKGRRPVGSPAAQVATLAGGLTVGWISVLLWARATAPGVPRIDSDLHAWALDHRTQATVQLARGFSWFGQTNIALPLVVLAGLAAAAGTRRFGRARAGAVLLGVGALGVGVGLGINRLVGRIRPPFEDWAGVAGGFAFPSGHTTAATVAAGLVAWSAVRRIKGRRARALVWVVAAGWAGAVGWSRVWLGVHWPTDVLGGWLFAGSFLLVARAVQLTWWPADAPPGGTVTR